MSYLAIAATFGWVAALVAVAHRRSGQWIYGRWLAVKSRLNPLEDMMLTRNALKRAERLAGNALSLFEAAAADLETAEQLYADNAVRLRDEARSLTLKASELRDAAEEQRDCSTRCRNKAKRLRELFA